MIIVVVFLVLFCRHTSRAWQALQSPSVAGKVSLIVFFIVRHLH